MIGFRIRSGLPFVCLLLAITLALFGPPARAQVYKLGQPDQHLQSKGIDTTFNSISGN